MEEASGEHRDIIIVGGGICGLATALALHRKGIKSMVIERSKTLRCSGAAIIVQANGWRALDRLGVASKLRQLAVPISTAHSIALDGGKSKKVPLGGGEMRCLRRADLMQVLAEDLPPNTVRFGCKMLSINLDPITSHPNIQIDGGSVLRPKIVIGCDGVNSTVAKFLEMKSTRLFSTCVVRGLTKYRSGHKFQNEFVVTRKGNVQLGRVPIDDMVVYWFLTRRWTSQDSMVSNDPKLIKESTVKELSSKLFSKEDVEMIRNSDRDQLFLTPLRYRAPWDLLLQTRFRKGTITVAGDAMHAMGPFIAQGGSASLEDAIVLTRCLAKTLSQKHTEREWTIMVKMAINEYVEERKMRVVLLTAQTFLIGMILDNSPLSLVKFMCVGLMAILFSDPNRHCLYDCGHL